MRHKNKGKVIDINKIDSGVGISVCQALIGMHAFTGCDTVSAFAGKGKAKVLKMLTHSKDYQDTFMELGREWDVSLEIMNKLKCFTCHLYAPKTSSTKVNELRYHLFCAKKGEVESHPLPPCKDCLVQHALRSNFQAAIWRRCLEQNPSIPIPGWKNEVEGSDTQLVVHWMTGQPAPQASLDLLACNCAKKSELPRCVCMTNGLKCTEMCRLQECDNQADHADDNEDVINELQDEIEEDYDF